MNEKVVRLEPTQETKRQLYLLSGNNCAYDGVKGKCKESLFDYDTGDFIGEICHIEAAMPNGQRFNAYMSNEARRHFDNLILLCRNHHKITDDVYTYSVDDLKKMKAEHERKFSTDRLIQEMCLTLRDYSQGNSIVRAVSLEKFFSIVEPNWVRTRWEIENSVRLFNEKLDQFYQLSLPAREVFLVCINRMHEAYMSDAYYFDPSEIRNAMMLNDWFSLKAWCTEIEKYGLITYDEEIHYDIDRYIGGYYFCSSTCEEGIGNSGYIEMNCWKYLKVFCDQTFISLNNLLTKQDFSSLDGEVE